jgi:hypothetical protein
LREIRLTGDPIGAEGVEAIAQAMRANISLERLVLGDVPEGSRTANARRIQEECARNIRLNRLLAQWEEAAAEGGDYAIPSELARLLGEALIVQDQKFGAAAGSEEETRMRLAMQLLSLQEPGKQHAAMPQAQ